MVNKYLAGAVASIGVLAGWLWLTKPSPAFTYEEGPQVQEQMKWPSVQIADENGNGFCSGTIISSELEPITIDGVDYLGYETVIMTAVHCLKNLKIGDAVNVNVTIPFDYWPGFNSGDVTFEAYVDYRDNEWDVAFIRQSLIGPAPVAALPTDELGYSLFFGQDAWNVSNPYGEHQRISQGLLGYIEYVNDGNWADGLWQTAVVEMAGGSSGSCLFVRDMDNNFVCIGVLSIKYNFEDHAFFVPWFGIQQSYKRYQEDLWVREHNV